jgi:hypothetical protein
LRVAVFADAEQRRGAFHDSELTFFHAHSLAQQIGECNACGNQRAPLPEGSPPLDRTFTSLRLG